MKIAVFGTGMVGKTIGMKLIELGYDVIMGSRTSDNKNAIEWVSSAGNKASTGTFEQAANEADIIFNCTKGEMSLTALKLADNNFKGKIIVDIANPLNVEKDGTISLIPALANTNSLGEEIQRQYPESMVVKTLNTMWCGIMVNPALVGKNNHINYICGNDEEAKLIVKKILFQFGWSDENILDLGDITASRGTEGTLLIWLRIYTVTKNGQFNFGILK